MTCPGFNTQERDRPEFDSAHGTLHVVPGAWRPRRAGNDRAWQGRMTARLLLASLVSLVLATGTAWAEPDSGSSAPGVTPPAASPVQVPVAGGDDGQADTGGSEWYGTPIIVVDSLAMGTSVLALRNSFKDKSAGMWALGSVSLVFSGPIVHLSRGEGGNAAISLGLRLGMPVIGAFLGSAHYKANCLECPGGEELESVVVGVMIGAAAASLIDIVLVARTRSTRKRAATTAWAPQLGIGDSQVTAGVAGWF
jgi:hypothetical protein